MKLRDGISWAGVYVGPGAWALSTQINYPLPYVQCSQSIYPAPWIAMLLAAISIGGAFLSYAALRTAQLDPAASGRKPRTEMLLAHLGIAIGILFALGILLQAYAGFVFNGCER